MDVTSLDNLYHLFYSGLILRNFLPTEGGGSSRCRLLEEEKFLPKLWGCFRFSSFTELVQRLMTCWLLFRPFDIFEGRVGLFLCGRTPCAITTPDMSIWNVSRVLTLYQTFSFPCLYYSNLLSQLSGSLSETIFDTSVFISWRMALSPPCGVWNSVIQNSGIGI